MTRIFSTQKKTSWSRINTPVNPMPRSSSQGVVYKHFIILFGGEFVSQSQSQYHHFRDVWRFDSQKSEWEELKALKGGPSARSGHRMVLWKRNAVVFGGFYDNAQECRYFDDLWILSQLDDVGKWQKVEVPSFSRPCPRSGHSLSLHENTLFVYGGYSTEKFNRFKKSEATVHHDLWMIDLSQVGSASVDSPVRWRKIKLGGIPPPIRAGVSSCFKDKKMYLFGGVVDVESPGGKVVSTFCNDLSVFHMDIERFFPIILSGKKRNDQSGPRKVVHDLEAELEELQLLAGKGSSSDSGSDSNTDSDDEDGVEKKDCEMKESFETRKNGAIYPHRRMDAAMTILGNSLYIYGGQFESGLKEITMSDLFRLNLNRNDTYEVLLSYDLSTNMWVGKEEESDNNSWESGSTVVSAAFDMDYLDDDDDDEEDDDEERDEVDFGEIPDEIQLDEGDDGEEAPQAIPANMDETGATLSHGDVADAITRKKRNEEGGP
ncbi:kelchcontaining protein [Angomonas deanei]|nr:kelchcontaining protein [Angomonas deanei]|eukprot:EPY32277.1 kelchcontaining protein [Angomonas deanei]